MSSDQSGVWLLPEDAAKYLDVQFNNERQFKKDSTLDVSRNFERGASCSSTNPFSSVVYVCVLKGDRVPLIKISHLRGVARDHAGRATCMYRKLWPLR